jgi:hypothetical protein
MLKLLNKIKFEHMFIVLLLVIQVIVLFKFSNNPGIIDKVIVSLIASVTAVTTFIFTKYNNPPE